MTTHASGTFEVKLTPLALDDKSALWLRADLKGKCRIQMIWERHNKMDVEMIGVAARSASNFSYPTASAYSVFK